MDQVLNDTLASANAAQSRYTSTKNLADLEEAIELYTTVIEKCHPDHPERSRYLIELVVHLLDHFTRADMAEDLDRAAILCGEALVLCPAGHKHHYTVVNNLSIVKAHLFQVRGDIKSLSESILYSRELLEAYPLGHVRRNSVLHNLATSLCTRFNHAHEDRDIEEALQIFRDILTSCSENTIPTRFTCLTKLATALQSRFEYCEQIDLLDEAIQHWKEALESCPPMLSSILLVLGSLADALIRRFDVASHIPDLQEAIVLYRQTLSLRRQYQNAEDLSLHSLANCLVRQFIHIGSVGDLEEAINFHRQELQCRPSGNKARVVTLIALASALCHYHGVYGKHNSLEEATDLYNEALVSCSHNEYRTHCFSGLGDALHRRFESVSGSAQDIDGSISYYRKALELSDPYGNLHYKLLIGLTAALLSRIDQSGLEEDINEMVSFDRCILELCPPESVDRAIALGDCGNGFCARFQQFGQMNDLEIAADYLQEAVNKIPVVHTVRPIMLNSLAFVRMLQFERLGRAENLNQAIEILRDAVGGDGSMTAYRPISRSNLASTLLRRFDLLRLNEDLEEAIQQSREAVKPVGNSASFQASLFGILGTALSNRFLHRTHTQLDLDEAVECHRNALRLCAPESRHLASHLNNLAVTLMTRFDAFQNDHDLDEAIEMNARAVQLRQEGHPERAASLKNLASLYYTKSQTRLKRNETDEKSIELSLQLYLKSANDKFGNPRIRVASAERCASIARSYDHSSTLSAYKLSMDLLEKCFMINPSLDMQFELLNRGFPSLALDAASFAIEKGELRTAVELLEWGRALLWSKMRGYRHSLDELRLVDESLATEFGYVCNQLRFLTADSGANSSFFTHKHAIEQTDQKWKRHRLLTEQWDSMVSRIRRVPGFEDFLQALPFDRLRPVSDDGPVIIINLSTYRSDALILLREEADPILVPLDKKLLGYVSGAYSGFSKWQKSSSATENFPSGMARMLRMLWNFIVEPVTRQLEKLGVASGSRIWWCPTSKLCALPLHAAGLHDKLGSKNLMDMYISSYTPTLAGLIRARQNLPSSKENPELLIIGQPDALPPLPMVRKEVQLVKSLIPTAVSLVGSAAMPESVLKGLRTTSWAHFACHGFLDEEHPFESSFQLYNKTSLTLRSIMQTNLLNTELAFLSACHSATGGDTNAPDETLHLAAAMQFCGYRSVVGTLWQMRDRDGPEIAEAFYKFMLQDGGDGGVNFKNSAKALHDAVKLMSDKRQGGKNTRASVQVSSSSVNVHPWITFIHIGA